MELVSSNPSPCPPVVKITDLPVEVMQCVLRYFSYGTIGKLRMVSKYFDSVCSDLLNTEFMRLKADIQERYAYLRSQLPRRESSRKKHPLADENEAIEALHLRIILLSISIGMHMQMNHCCFFAGEILDECRKLLTYIDKNGAKDVDEITTEIFDLASMAVEYFKKVIEPTLPNLWCNPESSGNSFDFSLKDENDIFSESANLGCESSLYVMKKTLDNLKKVTNENHRNLLLLQNDVRIIELDVESLESLVNAMKQHQKERKVLVIPENDVNNLFYKIEQCELLLDSIDSLPKPKRLKSNTKSSGSACTGNSTNKESHISGNLHSLSDSMPSCSTSGGYAYGEKVQVNASTYSKRASIFKDRKTMRKFKRSIKRIIKQQDLKK